MRELISLACRQWPLAEPLSPASRRRRHWPARWSQTRGAKRERESEKRRAIHRAAAASSAPRVSHLLKWQPLARKWQKQHASQHYISRRKKQTELAGEKTLPSFCCFGCGAARTCNMLIYCPHEQSPISARSLACSLWSAAAD